MSFAITGPGFYRQRNGGKVEVFAVRNGWWYGKELGRSGFDGNCWTSEGTVYSGIDNRSITGPWHEPPTPPDGFQLMPADYVSKPGDMYWQGGRTNTWLHPVIQLSATYRDAHYPENAQHYIASPIPKPALPDPGEGWRLLEDDETFIPGDECFDPHEERWRPRMDSIGCKQDRGSWPTRRRIPEPQPEWVATNEYRRRVGDSTGSVIVYWTGIEPHRREQKFVRGTEHEWREVQP
jgi:hypothetical protein